MLRGQLSQQSDSNLIYDVYQFMRADISLGSQVAMEKRSKTIGIIVLYAYE